VAAVEEIGKVPEAGEIYEGPVVRITDFGAFVQLKEGTDGLCHISELAHHHVKSVTDIVKVGELMKVKVLEVDPSGKIRLSRKALLPVPENQEEGDRDRREQQHKRPGNGARRNHPPRNRS
jgi:polyribonucleotide nucleotidyltransferase